MSDIHAPFGGPPVFALSTVMDRDAIRLTVSWPDRYEVRTSIGLIEVADATTAEQARALAQGLLALKAVDAIQKTTDGDGRLQSFLAARPRTRPRLPQNPL